jgi:hypothetical protein
MLVLETWNPHHGVDNSGYLDMEAFMNLIWGMSLESTPVVPCPVLGLTRLIL